MPETWWNVTQANHCFKIGKVILLQWTSQPTLKNSSIKRQPRRVIRLFILTHMWFPYGLVAHGLNTLRSRQNGRHFADDTFKPIFLNEKIRISIKISLKFVPKVPINNIPALVQIMAWRRPGAKPLSEPMMIILLTHTCVTRPQWVKVCSPLWLYFLFLFLQLSSDVKVIADDGHMMVPKVPLCMASPVFDSMLNSDFQESSNNEVQLPGKSLETIEFIARYINLREPCPIQGEWNNTKKMINMLHCARIWPGPVFYLPFS